MTINDFRDLEVWQRSVDVAADIYKLSRSFPREELFGFTSQMRKAAVSISSNIAEGSGRATTKDLLHFLSIARGSLRETESLLLLGERLEFTTKARLAPILDLIHRIGKMLTALRASLRKQAKRKTASRRR